MQRIDICRLTTVKKIEKPLGRNSSKLLPKITKQRQLSQNDLNKVPADDEPYKHREHSKLTLHYNKGPTKHNLHKKITQVKASDDYAAHTVESSSTMGRDISQHSLTSLDRRTEQRTKSEQKHYHSGIL